MPIRMIAGLVIAMVAIVGLLPAGSSAPSREIVLIARDMAFYLEGEVPPKPKAKADGPGTPNPTLEVNAGETVRIVLRNRDRGFRHDFAVPAADAALEPLGWNEDEALTFEAPKNPGTYEYICRPHQLMMKGSLRVR